MEYKGHEVVITYKRIKRLNAKIREGKILISAPYFTKNSEIEKFINSYSKRIDKILDSQKEIDPNIMYLWGNKYNIVSIEGEENKIILMEDIAYVFYKDNPTSVIDDYYMKETLDKLNYVARKYKDLMLKENIMFNKIAIKKLKSRWGSCKVTTKNITINSNLAKYDPLCLEYVFCHEIAHIKYPNHSKSFHEFIYTYFKDEQLARKMLKKYF
jgi:predicted metal-dependent hydrolase